MSHAENYLPPAFTLFLAYSSTLKMKPICSSETSVDFQRTTQRYVTEDRILHNHRCENLISYYVHHFHITDSLQADRTVLL
jgi:hypothetical protein